MKLLEMLRIVMINILQNKVKVMLTSIGIIVGSVTIVMVIAIGRGGEEEVKAQFSGLSAETVYVNLDYMKIGNKDFSEIPKLTQDLMEQMMDESQTLKGIYLRGDAYSEVTLNGKTEYISVTGVTEGYSLVSNLETAYGENISEFDVEEMTSVAVIGEGIAKKYYPNVEEAIGSTIRIGDKAFTIIGILERKGDGLQGLSADDTIFIPFTTAEQSILNEYTMPQIVALSKDLSTVKFSMKEMKSTLNYVLDDGSYYTLEDAGSRIEAATQSAGTMNMLLIAMATIVFIVGGIGIMNVLFLSIKERTKEIGILKALGSSKEEILLQFLFESVIISTFGGIMGVLLSYLLMPLMKYTNTPVSPSIEGQIIAIIFAMITGTLFGLYPAYKASQLKPIEALSYE
ncbi:MULTISPECIES: ABC transporter permease [Turicibacter]|jgi:efflux ABC transporter, permease protein|uniref:FtsX-like permease family protein n=3 Tax=Turicibacter sanguinis TaxID=154288 RepID=A0A9X5APF4_9FIRM|nr:MULTISPECIES: ABC transporter permease [Turicibacter]EFF64375.1 efflux ABC transporter, permease protein [Turicibacter sanguinis PC909]MBP3902990.1 ABC transporter permease [Turicibacter sp.]MCU7192113.1 ABC transporter permease [Turicibacter sanguinis]MCU7210285.1 ABC transporter permease [Turicibacter sanguinis]MDB8436940.1 ABC transporter permease [Turicibacter sanguinis]